MSALEWDSANKILYIGGKFDMLDEKHIPGGICLWTEATGLLPFDGIRKGLGLSPDMSNGEVTSLAYEQKSQVKCNGSLILTYLRAFLLLVVFFTLMELNVPRLPFGAGFIFYRTSLTT